MTHSILFILFHIRVYSVEESIYASFATSCSAEIKWSICVGEAEFAITFDVDTFKFSKIYNIVSIYNINVRFENASHVFATDRVFRIFFHRESSYTSMICMTANVSVRNTHSNPYCTRIPVFVSFFQASFTFYSVIFRFTFSYKVHNPHFVRVGNRERFARAGITVSFYKFRHHFYSFASVFGTLKGDIYKAAIVYNTLSF